MVGISSLIKAFKISVIFLSQTEIFVSITQKIYKNLRGKKNGEWNILLSLHCYSSFGKKTKGNNMKLETSQIKHYTGTEKQLPFHSSFCTSFQVSGHFVTQKSL